MAGRGVRLWALRDDGRLVVSVAAVGSARLVEAYEEHIYARASAELRASMLSIEPACLLCFFERPDVDLGCTLWLSLAMSREHLIVRRIDAERWMALGYMLIPACSRPRIH